MFRIQHLKHIRHYSSLPPRASLHSNKSPISTFWYQKFPGTYKYFSLIVAAAGSLRYVHPNTLVTVGPPLAIGSWFFNKWYKQNYSYKREINKIYPSTPTESSDPNNQILLKAYDETDVNNVLRGIENEFDSFKVQIIPLIEQKLIDHAILKGDRLGLFKSSSDDATTDQLSCKLGEDLETFIVLPLREKYLPYNDYQRGHLLKGGDEDRSLVKFSKFIKFSVPFYSSKDASSRKRLATVEAYLLQHENEDSNDQLYNISVEMTKYGLLNRRRLLIKDFERGGVTKSLQFEEKQDFIDI